MTAKSLPTALETIAQIADAASFVATVADAAALARRGFDLSEPYAQRVARARQVTGLATSLAWGQATVGGRSVVVMASDFRFQGAALAPAEASVIEAAFRHATQRRCPVVWLARGGGCCMFEGVHALLATARFCAARAALAGQGIPLVVVALHPLMAGSWVCASQADLVLAEESALIGFAGPRVVASVEKHPLPEGFQSAAFAFRHGQVDRIADFDELRPLLSRVLALLTGPRAPSGPVPGPNLPTAPACATADPWACVKAARESKPDIRQLVADVATDFVELHGDRVSSDDPAVFGGLAQVGGVSAMILGHSNTGNDLVGDGVRRNFSMAHPAGHRKALRLVEMAERFGLPLVTFIDTPGVCPDVQAEEENQGYHVGRLVTAMLGARVPSLGFILGEGGAAGALGLATVDRLYMTAGSYYSVICPEAAAAILLADPGQAATMAGKLRLSPPQLLEDGVIDGILPTGDPADRALAASVKGLILHDLRELAGAQPQAARRCRTKLPASMP